MSDKPNESRRRFLGITGMAGLSTLAAQAVGINLGMVEVVSAQTGKRGVEPFRFAMITDSHLYDIPDHKFDQQLIDAVDQVNAMDPLPDFVIYGGDIAHAGKPEELLKGQRILSRLKMPMKVIPGEHDWYLDMGKAWHGLFGDDNWSFNHKGIHFIGMNSILVDDFWTAVGMSDKDRMEVFFKLASPIAGPWGVGEPALEWLKKDVAKIAPDVPVVIFTHSPLWDYYPRWNFQTRDAAQIREILSKFENVMAFHGHVHQTVFNKMGNMSSVGSMSTSWPWPYPPVDLPFPESQMYRADPSIATDGQGTLTADLKPGYGLVNFQAFEDSLTPWLSRGIKV
jgi:3',5'-cyclic AMP phosphodiesterase CpdA